MQETQVQSRSQEDPLEKEMATCIFAWETHGQKSLETTVDGVTKESDTS